MLKPCLKPTSDPNKPVDSLKSVIEPLLSGMNKGNSKVLKQKEDRGDISSQMSSPKREKNSQNEKSVIVESQLLPRRKTWKDRLSSSELNTLTTKLSRTLDRVSTSKERDLTPFWTVRSKRISEKLWLPTEIDSVDSVLNSQEESSRNIPKGKSWFSIKKKRPRKRNSLMTSFQLSQFSLPGYTGSGVIPSRRKLKKQLKKEKKKINKTLKTLKIRLFPNEEEKEKLQMMLEQYRWYYNTTLSMIYLHYGKDKILNEEKYSAYTVRNLLRKYEYKEEAWEHLIFKELNYDENRNEIPIPDWWIGKVHSRIPRGASNKLVASLNSAISNYRNGNIRHFQLKYRTKKNPTDYLNFEDKHYPKFIRKIKSRYWYTTKDRKRVNISFSDIDTKTRGFEIIYEKDTNRYFLHYPIEHDWFPEEDRRIDNQEKFIFQGDRVISLDPGVRKFLVGYDPSGCTVFVGEGAQKKLINILYSIDEEKNSKEKRRMWTMMRNMINDLHWKTISFLIENYDVIILPDFRVSQMVRKRNIGKMTKRLLCMFSFYTFKERLQYKCSLYDKKLIILKTQSYARDNSVFIELK